MFSVVPPQGGDGVGGDGCAVGADAGRTSGRAVPRSTGRSVLGQCTVDGLWCVGWVAAGWPFEPGGDLGPAPCPARSGQAGTPCCPQTRMIRAVVGPRVRPGRVGESHRSRPSGSVTAWRRICRPRRRSAQACRDGAGGPGRRGHAGAAGACSAAPPSLVTTSLVTHLTSACGRSSAANQGTNQAPGPTD